MLVDIPKLILNITSSFKNNKIAKKIKDIYLNLIHHK